MHHYRTLSSRQQRFRPFPSFPSPPPSGTANMLAGQKKNLLAVAKNWYHQFSIHTLSLIQGNKSVCGFHLGYLDGETELITQAMTTILDLYKEGKVKPRIDSTWHLEQVCVVHWFFFYVDCVWTDPFLYRPYKYTSHNFR